MNHLLLQISRYMDMYPNLRFGQALFNLGINEFADNVSPGKHNWQLRDIYYDTTDTIASRVKKALKSQYKITKLGSGDLMTRRAFANRVREGTFTNYDGHGYYATRNYCSDILVFPSDIWDGFVDMRIDSKLTHVMWYNK